MQNNLDMPNPMNITSIDTHVPSSQSSQPGKLIAANSDDAAILTWLEVKGNKSDTTRQSYAKEARRFHIWCRYRGYSLSDINLEDVNAYFRFLANPPAMFIRPRNPKKTDRLTPTQILPGPSSVAGVQYARKILSQMYSYLQDSRYLAGNPFAISAAPVAETAQDRRAHAKAKRVKYLTIEAWLLLWNYIVTMPSTTRMEQAHAIRCRWLFALLYHTGMRRSEILSGQMGDFIKHDGSWSLLVPIAKGDKSRQLTVNSALLRELRLYRAAIKLPEFPNPSETTPLLATINQRDTPLCPSLINRIFMSVREQAVLHVTNDPHIRVQFERMTPHTIRHSFATHRTAYGISLEMTQQELGHSNLQTTQIYAKLMDNQLRQAAEKLAGNTPDC
jgi:integrase/recombinase XerC